MQQENKKRKQTKLRVKKIHRHKENKERRGKEHIQNTQRTKGMNK